MGCSFLNASEYLTQSLAEHKDVKKAHSNCSQNQSKIMRCEEKVVSLIITSISIRKQKRTIRK